MNFCRTDDPRLIGEGLNGPFWAGYRAVYHAILYPRNPNWSLVYDTAIRILKVLVGVSFMAVGFLPFLLGRAIQIVGYHFFVAARDKEPLQDEDLQWTVNNLTIHFKRVGQVPATLYHGTNAVLEILRTHFEAIGQENRFGPGVYFSEDEAVSAHYGGRQIRVHLDLLPRECLEITSVTVQMVAQNWTSLTYGDFVNIDFARWCQERGIRAIRYQLDGHGKCWVIFDPSGIWIDGHNRAPRAAPTGVLLAN